MNSGEFERIRRLAALFGRPPGPARGVGDDGAVLYPAHPVVVSVDASVEGVHFRRDFVSLEEASARAVEAAMSDVAAMGGDLQGPGCGILLAWTLSPEVTDEEVDMLGRGAQRAAARAKTFIVGGNLAAAPTLTLSTTVFGRLQFKELTRDAARLGDVVAVSGPVGAAALGLRALTAGRGGDPRFAPFVAKWRAPRARIDLGPVIAPHAHAAIDLSDGLAQDGRHLAQASRVALVIDADAIPMLPEQDTLARELGVDAVGLAFAGGEDYELLATGKRDAFDARWTIIGTVAEGEGVHVRDASGTRAIPADAGWDHFRATVPTSR